MDTFPLDVAGTGTAICKMGTVIKSEEGWTSQKERGSTYTIRFMIWLCQRKFRFIVNLLLYPISAYFFITGSSKRSISREFFLRATGQQNFADYFKQLLCFSRSLVDRVSILQGNAEQFTVIPNGRDKMMAEIKRGQGLILLGSHLGNFEASKLFIKAYEDVDVYIVAYYGHSRKIRSQLDAINPHLASKVIDPTEPEAPLKMRDVILSGGVLAILGDRIGIGEKTTQVDFLGKPALFPAGPYYLASILKCPVYCFFGVRTGSEQYHSYVIKLASSIDLPRGKREEALNRYAQKYADILGQKASEYPENWFNFFDFWSSNNQT